MIFLDTSYINGLILKNDSHSVDSGNIEPYLENESKATNITVLVEVLNSLTNYNFFGNIDDLLSYLFNFEILDCLTSHDYNSAMLLFKYYNGSINFSDCTILQSMQKFGITRIASFDSDFDKIKGIQRIGGFN
ncbi:type II toxin-antitoxin system VapC family toxin [Methanobrevibacter sp.]|uniref:type II toxin-antitoxin system VapC family toxin n=1 Tax=Methanobrevibacter sp. TaxID=66852 RepID=UPI0025CF71B7|nr:type II toxin-antitoxin system VapC family toxin [Methanobrevibacter sp.]MBR6993841.1 type II toxin-antitoxin system VapC family toxin [Methanobrevibacter sp.]